MNELTQTFPEIEGTYIVIPDKYAINCETGLNLNLHVAFTNNDPNLDLPKTERTLEFKHYRNDGSKYWTSKKGVEYTFSVPKNKIRIVKEEGYSYPKIEINGQIITLNTSGGCGGNSNYWVDWISNDTTTCVNLDKKQIQALLDASEQKQLILFPL